MNLWQGTTFWSQPSDMANFTQPTVDLFPRTSDNILDATWWSETKTRSKVAQYEKTATEPNAGILVSAIGH